MVKKLSAQADVQKEEAQMQASELRRQLTQAEQVMNEKIACKQEILEEEHMVNIWRLQEQQATATEQSTAAEKEVEQLRNSLVHAERTAAEKEGLEQRQQTVVSSQHAAELRALQEQHTETERRRKQAEEDAK